MSLWVISGRAFEPPLAPPSPFIAEEPAVLARRSVKPVSRTTAPDEDGQPDPRAADPMTSSMNKLHLSDQHSPLIKRAP